MADLPPLHVLVIEDDPMVRGAIVTQLRRLGCRVSEAPEGEAGIAKHRKDPADVVLTDMNMEGKDGATTIQDMRAEDPDVRIVAMSGGGAASTDAYLIAALGLGANAALPKPFTVADLSRALGIAR